MRTFGDVVNRSGNFVSKFLSGDRAAFKVPINSSFVLVGGIFEKFESFIGHDRAW